MLRSLAEQDSKSRYTIPFLQMIGLPRNLYRRIRIARRTVRRRAKLSLARIRESSGLTLRLRMRAKFLCSLALVITALTGATLLAVRHAAQVYLQREIDQDTHNAITTFAALQHQHEIALSHKADLLATLVAMRNEDASAIQEPSEDPWESEDCNLFALADRSGKIVALHTTIPGFDPGTAQAMFQRSLRDHQETGWWYDGTHLYEVVLKAVYTDGPPRRIRAGTVAVGYEIDADAAEEFRAASSTQAIFRYSQNVVVSTLSPLQELEFEQQTGTQPATRRIRIGDEPFLARTVDLTTDNPLVSLTVLKSYKGTAAFLDRLDRLLLGLGFLAVLAGGALVYLISDAFTRPLVRLTQGVRALEAGDFKYPLEARGGDEAAELTRSFDRMRATLLKNDATRRELETQLRQSQRMEAMGRLAGGVAHDFNNLLTVIKGHSSILLGRLGEDDPRSENGRQIEKAADRAASLTRQLLAFSRMQVLQPKIVELNSLVADMQKLLIRLLREDISFSFRPGESLGRVKADHSQLEQVILNLTVNACDAMPHGGQLILETRNVTVNRELALNRPPMPAGDYVALSVSDTGEGMDAQTKARIFEPFFTTKEVGKGTGLGLATVYGVVKQSGGFIWVDSEPGKGARFEVYLPRVNDTADLSQPEDAVTAPAQRRKTVLIAEDESSVRELASDFLKSAGYMVLAAENGVDALSVFRRSEETIHVLLTDVVMPKMRGPELAERLRRLQPNVRVIYMSGYLEYDRGNGEFLEDGFFLQKPFSRDALVQKMAEALSAARKSPSTPQPV